jgi:hypothetical protein
MRPGEATFGDQPSGAPRTWAALEIDLGRRVGGAAGDLFACAGHRVDSAFAERGLARVATKL